MVGSKVTSALVAALLLFVVVFPSQQAMAQDDDADPVGDDVFTVIAIPDTQNYTKSDAGEALFKAQFDWIAAQQGNQNIVFVSHVGDVADLPASETQWDRVERIYSTLDAAGIPYGIAPGNHDIDLNANAPEFDARFGVDRYEGLDWFGGAHAAEGTRSSYQTTSVNGHDLLFVHVRHLRPEYGSTAPVIEWVGEVLADHPDHLAFVTTHEFTSADGAVVMPDLLAELRQHCTVAVIFSGHRGGEVGRGQYLDDCGRSVEHVFTNLQFFDDGGGGYLRRVAIDRFTLEATFSVYSPVADADYAPNNPAASFTTSLSPLAIVPGDVDCTRTVNIQDARRATQYAILLIGAEFSCPLRAPGLAINAAAGDVDGDGMVTIEDARALTLCAIGIEDRCP